MKKHISFTLPALAVALAACQSMNAPISSGDFDPLRPPGSELGGLSDSGPQIIRPGQFAIAAIDNTAFYNARPRGDAEADKLLRRGTSLKVISTAGSYYRVELDSGEVGFVPTVMVEDPNAVPEVTGDMLGLYPGVTDITPIDPTPAVDEPSTPDVTIPPVLEPEIPTTPVPPPSPIPPPPPPPAPPSPPAPPTGASGIETPPDDSFIPPPPSDEE